MAKYLLLFFAIIIIYSCKNEPKKNTTKFDSLASQKQKILDSPIIKNTFSSSDYNYWDDSFFFGHKSILKYYFKKYNPDTCQAFPFDKVEFHKYFKGFSFVGEIKNNGVKDSVLVLDKLSYCQLEDQVDLNGQAYYFTDTTLPRLQTNSACCYPSNVFSVGDIDEDGISEIGLYFSSCASHYKSLYVYTLKQNKWKEVGHSVYDLFYMDVNKPFSNNIKKSTKGKFKMLEITDLTNDNSKSGKPNWKQFEF